MRLLVTGFESFGPHAVNPSQRVVEALDHEWKAVLPVTYSGVDQFISDFNWETVDGWLMLGVSGPANSVVYETVARNYIGIHPDNNGHINGPGPFDGRLPAMVHNRLWAGFCPPEGVEPSYNAGDYLCNFVSLQAAVRLDLPTGFVHLPTFEVLDFETQLATVNAVIAELTAAEKPFRIR